jgi:hypothetical protein
MFKRFGVVAAQVMPTEGREGRSRSNADVRLTFQALKCLLIVPQLEMAYFCAVVKQDMLFVNAMFVQKRRCRGELWCAMFCNLVVVLGREPPNLPMISRGRSRVVGR